MKITKRQLRRIIREEKQKLNEVSEGEAALRFVQMQVEQLIERLADKYFDGELGDGAFDAQMTGDEISREILTRAAKLARESSK